MTAVRRCSDCGGVLSRYNNGVRCQTCTATAGSAGALLVPNELVADPAFQRALDAGDWETALTEITRATGVTQVALSAATGVSQSHISRLMNGRSAEPGIAVVRALCDGLAIPRRLAGLADARNPEDETNRRQAIGVGAGAAGLALLGVYSGSGTAGDDLLLAEMTVTLRRLEQNTPTRALISSATAHAELIRGTRERSGAGTYSTRLCGVESEANGFAAWLFADLAEHASARRHYRRAIKAAQLSRNPLLTCYMRGSFGQFATSTGAAVQGRELLSEARYHLPKSAPPIARLWLDALEGTALAYMGDRGALSLLDSAERQMKKVANTEPVWPWLFHFDERKLAGHRAMAAGRLGYHKMADTYFDLASQATTSPKQRAMSTVARATVMAASNSAGAIDQACMLASQALDTGRMLGSERVIGAVRDFRAGVGIKSSATIALDKNLSASYEEDL